MSFRAFLLATASVGPNRAFILRKPKPGNELLAGIRKWNKVISSAEH